MFLGIIPINAKNEPICKSVTGVCTLVVLLIIIENNIIKSEKVNYIYPKYIKYLIVFFSVWIFALLYRIVEDFLNKKLEERKENKEKEEDIINDKINEKERLK